jgi:hypothetical protein
MKPIQTSFFFIVLFSLIPHSGQSMKLTPEQEQKAKVSAELRMNYAKSAEYKPYGTEIALIKAKCWELVEKDKLALAIEEADRGLAIDKWNISLLMVKATAFRAQGDTEKADALRQQWMSLVDSILSSGDGQSFSTAFQVISVDEEYAILEILKVKKISQRYIQTKGIRFDVFRVKHPNSGESDLYFNVDIPKKWLEEQVASGKIKAAKPPM